MPVVSNTSPILNLAIVGQLGLLKMQFSQILVPLEVVAELKPDEQRPGSVAIQQALDSGWIQSQPLSPQSLPSFTLLRQHLDLGESAAIALALEIQAKMILLDEREGRKTAKSLGLNITGLLGVLLKARATGTIPALKPIVDDLMSLAGFRISPALLERILENDMGP